jgi:diadenosine tetraphosphate (Ap4A) HIT family hydrolase
MSVQERIDAARAGTNPRLITRMPSGWAVLGDDQFFSGYSVLLADPVVDGLNSLDAEGRAAFLRDMGILGDALLEATGACRLNYEILGNTDHALHVHIFPRYQSEPEELRKVPVWFYDRAQRSSRPFDAARDSELISKIAAAIRRRTQAFGS